MICRARFVYSYSSFILRTYKNNCQNFSRSLSNSRDEHPWEKKTNIEDLCYRIHNCTTPTRRKYSIKVNSLPSAAQFAASTRCQGSMAGCRQLQRLAENLRGPKKTTEPHYVALIITIKTSCIPGDIQSPRRMQIARGLNKGKYNQNRNQYRQLS